MSDINMIVLEGRVLRTELRSTPSGVSVFDIYLANNRFVPRGGRQREIDNQSSDLEFKRYTTYAKITLWNEKASKWADILQKGDRIFVSGKLVDDNYIPSGQENPTRGRLKIDNVDRIRLLERTSDRTEEFDEEVSTEVSKTTDS